MEKFGLDTSKKTKIENSDVDTEKNKMYVDVLKKYFGYKSFRPYANLNGYTLNSWLILIFII